MSKQIKSMQNDENYIVLNNPLRSPKFIRMIGKEKELTVNEIYTPKIFYEIVSRLNADDLKGIVENQSIKFDINIADFLHEIGANPKNFKHLINSIETLQTTLLKWKDGNSIHRSPIVAYSIHDPKSGKIQVQVHEKLVRHILEVKDKENFSFLKSNVFRLQNAQAIRLYPFFKSWLNYCFDEKTGNKKPYETELNRFKEQFGYDTSGYRFWNNFEIKVLKTAIEEINEKTDLIVSYETTGANLDGLRPRVTGLIFWIVPKNTTKKLSNGEEHAIPQTPIKEVLTATIEVIKPIEPTLLQPQTPQEPPKAQSEFIEIDKETTDTIKKINPQITAEQVNVLIEIYGNIRLWEMAQGALIEHKKDPIKNIIGYFKTTSSMLGLGLYKQKEEKTKKEVERKAKERAEQEAQDQLKTIIKQYDINFNVQCMQAFEVMSQEQKDYYTAYIQQKMPFAKSHFYIGSDLNENGQRLAGEYAMIGEQYDRKRNIIDYARNYGFYLRADVGNDFIIERIEATPQEQSQVTVSQPEKPLTNDQLENIENHKKGLLSTFTNWFKN